MTKKQWTFTDSYHWLHDYLYDQGGVQARSTIIQAAARELRSGTRMVDILIETGIARGAWTRKVELNEATQKLHITIGLTLNGIDMC
jgi:hypothetical protein